MSGASPSNYGLLEGPWEELGDAILPCLSPAPYRYFETPFFPVRCFVSRNCTFTIVNRDPGFNLDAALSNGIDRIIWGR